MALAERLLDDEGQVEVSVLIDEGKTKLAQIYLPGALDQQMVAGGLSVSELAEL